MYPLVVNPDVSAILCWMAFANSNLFKGIPQASTRRYPEVSSVGLVMH